MSQLTNQPTNLLEQGPDVLQSSLSRIYEGLVVIGGRVLWGIGGPVGVEAGVCVWGVQLLKASGGKWRNGRQEVGRGGKKS